MEAGAKIHSGRRGKSTFVTETEAEIIVLKNTTVFYSVKSKKDTNVKRNSSYNIFVFFAKPSESH